MTPPSPASRLASIEADLRAQADGIAALHKLVQGPVLGEFGRLEVAGPLPRKQQRVRFIRSGNNRMTTLDPSSHGKRKD